MRYRSIVRYRSIIVVALAVSLTVPAEVPVSAADRIMPTAPVKPPRMASVPGTARPVRPPATDQASQAAVQSLPAPAAALDQRAVTSATPGAVTEVQSSNVDEMVFTVRGALTADVAVDYTAQRYRYGGDWAA